MTKEVFINGFVSTFLATWAATELVKGTLSGYQVEQWLPTKVALNLAEKAWMDIPVTVEE